MREMLRWASIHASHDTGISDTKQKPLCALSDGLGMHELW